MLFLSLNNVKLIFNRYKQVIIGYLIELKRLTMTIKKILGYVFILLSLLLTLAFVGKFLSLFKAVLGLFKIFTGTIDDYESGKIIGFLLYWVFHVFLTIVLWRYGRKWIDDKSIF